MARSRLSGLALAIALWVAAGCNAAPTLPLPPPVAEVSTPDESGYALVTGEVNPEAYVFVFNENLELGVITRADEAGAFEVLIRAEPNDLITIWQESQGVTGEQKQTVVPED